MPHIALSTHVFHAWWESNDSWDGYAFYTELETAKTSAALDYLGYEYCCNRECEDEGTDDHVTLPTLTWAHEYNSWHLLADGTATNVQVSRTPVYRAATPREKEEQDALRAIEKAQRAAQAAGPHKPLAEQLEDLFARRGSTT